MLRAPNDACGRNAQPPPHPPSDTFHFGLGGREKPGEIDDGLPEISAVAQISNSQPFFLRSQL